MSTTIAGHEAGMSDEKTAVMDKKESSKNYKGFVAGVFSGVSKLTGMYSFYLRLFQSHSPPSREH